MGDQTTDYGPRTTDHGLRTTDYGPRTADYGLRTMRDYAKIQAWKLADDLAVSIYQATKSFPREEIYGLTSQLRRASYSVRRISLKAQHAEAKKIICIFCTFHGDR